MSNDDKTGNPKWGDATQTDFNATRFKKSSEPWYADGSDAYANQQEMYMSFLHVPSNSVVSFKAFLTTFNETFNSDWAAETVYGRADPIYMFKNTTRKISLAFKIPAASEGEAYENLGRVQKLVQFLYPNYTTLIDPITGTPDQFAQTISQSPLVRLKMFNLLNSHAAEAGPGLSAEDVIGPSSGAGGQTSFNASPAIGLLGIIENVTVQHNLEGDVGGFNAGKGVILPKLLEVNMSFAPIHEHALGWTEENQFTEPSFPYSVDVQGSFPATTTDEQGHSDGCASYGSEAAESNALLVDESSQAPEECPGADAAEQEAAAEGMKTLGTYLSTLNTI